MNAPSQTAFAGYLRKAMVNSPVIVARYAEITTKNYGCDTDSGSPLFKSKSNGYGSFWLLGVASYVAGGIAKEECNYTIYTDLVPQAAWLNRVLAGLEVASCQLNQACRVGNP